MTKRAKFARLALILSVLIVLWFAIAMFGARAGLWKPLTGFATMTMQPALYLLGTAGAVAVAALIATLIRSPRQGWVAALVALAIPAAIFAGLGALRSQAESVPFIHDIATDTADPPAFSDAMMKKRADDEALNELYPYDVPLDTIEKWQGQESVKGKTIAQLIATGYPDLDLSTLTSDAEPAIALKAIDQAMKTRGLVDIRRDEKAGIVEGTDVVFWYGFRDDVVGRVRAGEDGGSVIDFRSVSRVGLSDLGVNAQRIADLRAGVAEILSDQKLRDQLAYYGEDKGKLEMVAAKAAEGAAEDAPEDTADEAGAEAGEKASDGDS